MSQAARTTDHKTIQKWVEKRGGRPATVKGTERKGEDAGLLRIDFPSDGMDPGLSEVSWEDFFEKFDESNLEFLYQDKTEDGKESRFCKFVNREG
jgi:hypothetical protein